MQDLQDTLSTNGRDLTISGVNLNLGQLDTFGPTVTTIIDIDASGPIPETGTAGVASFTFTVPAGVATIEDLDVRFSAAHTYDSDLRATLTSPDGGTVVLFSEVGGENDNFQDTLFDDEATTPIASGSAPFDDSFRPQDALTAFDGQSASGTWTLTVDDLAALDTGTLYKAGDSAPWGIAQGTQLLIDSTGKAGTVNLVASGDISVRDYIGDALQAIANGNITLGNVDTSVPPEPTIINIDAGGPIPDTGSAGTATFTFQVSEEIATIEDLDVRFSAAHTWNSDLKATLTSPEESSITLFSGVGDSGDNFQDTILDDEASDSISSGSAPFEGQFQSQDALATFDGQSPNGTWTLTVDDFVESDAGTLYQAGEVAPWGVAEGTQLIINSEAIGTGGNVESTGGMVLLAGGNVNLVDYSGDSLHVLAGGSVTLTDGDNNGSAVRIEGIGAPETTINGTTFPSLASLQAENIEIDGNAQAMLDVRSGVDWTTLGGSPTNQIGSDRPPASVTATPERADITFEGNIRVDAPNGLVLLTNQFVPNPLPGNISVADAAEQSFTIDTIPSEPGGDGGDVLLYSRDNITLDNISSDSNTELSANGNVTLQDYQGDSLQVVAGGDIELGKINDTPPSEAGVFNVLASGPIPEFGIANFTFEVPESFAGRIDDLEVRFSAQHTYVSDLDVTLTSPAETSITLFSQVGGFGEDFQDTLLDDEAAIAIASGSAPFASSFQPQDSLATFDEESAVGEWTLTVEDTAPLDAGTLYQEGESASWGIAQGTQLLFNTEPVNAEGNIESAAGTVLLAGGDVNVTDYSGGSLHVLAGGNVTLKDGDNNGSAVTIDNTGSANATISGSNFSDLRVIDAFTTAIDGSTQATLDIRSGVDWAALAEVPGVPTPTATPTAANINLEGSLRVDEPSGLLLLTNQFMPNANPGTISNSGGVEQTIAINTSTNELNGGEILIGGRGDIAFQDVDLTSSSNSGSSGDIQVITRSGNVTLTQGLIDASSESGTAGHIDIDIRAAEGNVLLQDKTKVDASSESGTAGTIAISATGGSVLLQNNTLIDTSSTADSAGTITLSSDSGNIELSDSALNSASSVFSFDDAGNGGTISLITDSGDIQLSESTTLDTKSFSFGGNAAQGGAISLQTNTGNITLSDSKLNALSGSLSEEETDSGNAGNAGPISIMTNIGTIALAGTNLNAFSGTLSSNTAFGSGNAGQGGRISLSTDTGNLEISESRLSAFSYSESAIAGSGGEIALNTNSGTINFTASTAESESITASETGTAGTAGDISFAAPQGSIQGQGSNVFTFALGQLGTGGNVALEAQEQISGLEIVTLASDGNSGDVSITGNGNLSIQDLTLATSATFSFEAELPDPSDPKEVISIEVDEVGDTAQAGDTTITNQGNLTLTNVTIESSSNNDQQGGSISIESLEGNIDLNSSTITSNAESSGPAGDINLTALKQIILDDSQLASATNAIGNGGQITIEGSDLVLQNNSQISTESASDDEDAGDAGDIEIISSASVTINNSNVTAETTGNGIGGDIETTTNRLSVINNGEISAETSGDGAGGSITLGTNNINLDNRGQISASSSGSGNGGNIDISYSDRVSVTGEGEISVNTTGNGNAGTIEISQVSDNSNGPTAVTIDGARLTASTGGDGQGGNIEATTDELNVINNGQMLASTASEGEGGSITLETSNINLDNKGQISVSTQGAGPGGSIIFAPPGDTLSIQGNGEISVATEGSGTAGSFDDAQTLNSQNPVVEIPRITLDGASLTASTSGAAPGGNIAFQTNQLRLDNNGAIVAETTGSGAGGNITINGTIEETNGVLEPTEAPANLVRLNDSASISADATGTGPAGNISINTEKFQIEDSSISVSSTAGEAGDLRILANSTDGKGFLLNSSELTAEAGGDNAEGGSIFIEANDPVLTFTDRSLISAKATGANASGGNVTINAPNSFMLATTFNDNDILATANDGQGGKINITALRIYGFVPRLAGGTDNDGLRDNDTNDISATSEESSLNGEVIFDVLSVDPVQDLVELADDAVDRSNQIIQACSNSPNTLVVTGRGGLPARPGDTISADGVDVPWVVNNGDTSTTIVDSPTSPELETSPLVEAQAIEIDESGNAYFVADPEMTDMSQSSDMISGFCGSLQP